MRNLLLSFAVAGLLVSAGCKSKTVIVVNQPPADVPHGAEIVYVDDRTTIAEIDAVDTLSFENNRYRYLLRIAKRPDLGPAAQRRLVDATFAELSFANSRTGVLMALAKNPVLCGSTKRYMLEQLDRLSFESSRSALLRVLSRRTAVDCEALQADENPQDASG